MRIEKIVAVAAVAFLPALELAAMPSVQRPGLFHLRSARKFTGIPSVAVSQKNGRLWATWYAGTTAGEDSNNYCVLATSADSGREWKEVLVADPDGKGPLRAFDPEVFVAGDGKLRWVWTERVAPLEAETKQKNSGCLADPRNDQLFEFAIDAENEPSGTLPAERRIGNGVMMCKPAACRDGTLLYPVARWNADPSACFLAAAADGSFSMRGGISLPREERQYDEHQFVCRNDGSLMAFMRVKSGIMRAFSRDDGKTWGRAESFGVKHCASRFFLRRLASGKLLLVKHGPVGKDVGRSHLTAYVSGDDGLTWQGGLELDARAGASYPDGDQAADGTIYVVYDYSRTKEQRLYIASFTERDVEAGKDVSGKVRLKGTLYAPAANPPRNAVQKPFAFRKNLESPHVPGRRDFSLKAGADEFAFTDGCTVPDADFADYLKVSMGVDAKVGSGGAVEISIDGRLEEREYRISVSRSGVSIVAHDERASRRALFHLEDLMSLRRAPFLKIGSERRRPVFSPRMTHSGWALDDFPDGHLNQLAHYGFDAILIFVEGIDRTKGGRRFDIADSIRRAKKYGLDTYIYSYITAFAHPDDPGSQKVFDETYGKVAAAYPDAKGIVFVGESAEFPSKDERTSGMSAKETRMRGDKRPAAGRFPSRDYPDWINAVKRTLHAKSPGMEFIFWTYNWGGAKEDLRLDFIRALPKDVALMATFEMYESHKKRNGLHARIDDYSLCVAGPGRYFASEAMEAKRQGLRLFTMSNTGGLTWDFGTVPYLPMPQQWKKRWDALKAANADWGLCGLMENHHYGWYPSFVSELAKEAFTEGGMDFGQHIRKIAARDFGAENAETAVQAWETWSRAIEDYLATAANQYGPFRIGPAYPFNALRERIDNLKVEWPQDAINSRYICRQNYLEANFQNTGARVGVYLPSLRKELELLSGTEEDFRQGSAAFASMGTPAAQEMADLGEYLMRCVTTAANVKRGAIAETIALDEKLPEDERQAAREEVERLAQAEYANAQAAIPLLERNSRLGWEPTMGYAGGAEMIRVKLRRMQERYPAIRQH